MGQGESVWVHIEGIRRWIVHLEVDKPKCKEYMKDVHFKWESFWEGSETYRVQKWSKTYGFGIWVPGTKKLS